VSCANLRGTQCRIVSEANDPRWVAVVDRIFAAGGGDVCPFFGGARLPEHPGSCPGFEPSGSSSPISARPPRARSVTRP